MLHLNSVKRCAFPLVMVVCGAMLSCVAAPKENQGAYDKVPVGSVLDLYGEIEVIAEVVDSGNEEGMGDVDIVALWEHNTKTGNYRKILQTVRDECIANLDFGDCNRYVQTSIDSIPAAHKVFISDVGVDEKGVARINQMIVEGCPDYRNFFSFVVDLKNGKTWCVPSNAGFMGVTSEEFYLVFQSFRYNSWCEVIDGEETLQSYRYSFIKVFNEDGVMVDSLSLARHHD